MLSVCQCDRIRPLAEHLFAEMERAPLPPLEPEVVVVAQNKGLRGWLKNALARRSGCAASVTMPALREQCLRLARALLPVAAPGRGDSIPRDPFDPGPLTWRIAAWLEDLPAEDCYLPLRTYLDEGADRRLSMARRIAQRFSDYQVYRPRLLQQWAAGENPYPDHPHAMWQAPLWQHLASQGGRLDRARRLLALRDKLRDGRFSKRRLPTRVSVFGAGLSPPLYLDVLEGLARHVPVRFYLVSGEALAAGAEGNALRRRLGTQRNILREQLQERADEWETLDGRRRPTTLLGAVQTSTLAGEERRAGASPDPDDRSLQVLSCHSPRRELEVLRDQLLDAFETLPDLRPDEVLVAVPALEEYAPLIETTFEAEEAGAGPQLPVHIASGQWSEERRVLQAMEALLALPEGRHTATEVMELLDYPVLRRAAGLAPEEVPVVRRWVQEAGVRWGRNAGHREAFGLPAAASGTWEAGIERLLLGYVMGPTEDFVEGRLPHAEANADRADLLGRLAAWLHRLFAFVGAVQAPRSLHEWSALMTEAAADLLAPVGTAEHDAVHHLVETACGLEHLHALASDGVQSVSFAAVRSHLQEAIAAYEASAEYVTGRITFAEPMALRFAPFRVVAFLGLGNAFPPTPARPTDDLIAADSRPTDHDAQRESEQLFCDALLAAEDRLILTYVGRSEKDNAECAPSAVLEALMETCEHLLAGYDDAEAAGLRERLVAEHPLQPFNPAYFESESAFFSYSRLHRPEQREPHPVRPFVNDALPPAEEPDTAVHLDDLQRAWAHPARYFCTRVLGLRLEGEAVLETQEPLCPDALAAYQVREKMMSMALAGAPPETWGPRLEAEGMLPPVHLGQAWQERQRSEVQTLARAVEARGERRPRTLRAGGDGWRIAGRLDHVTDTCALAFRCAAPKAKDLVRAWAAHLLLCAAGEDDLPCTTLVMGTGTTGWRLTPLDAGAACEQLHRLVRGYRRIRQAPPPFWPETALAFASAGSRYRAERSAKKAFYHDRWSPGEDDDPYVKLCFRARDPLVEDFDRFEKWANAFWKPLLDHREEISL